MYEAEERGELKKTISIAKNFLALGLPLSTIAQGTGLSEEQIKKLQ